MGIGDTTGPLDQTVIDGIKKYADLLGTESGYEGYGPSEGILPLRKALIKNYYLDILSPQEIFVSDGAKCDLSRLLFFFGSHVKIGLQSPSYPAFIDDTVLSSASGPFHTETSSYPRITLFPCSAENNFSPDFETSMRDIDLLYLCNPNNPTGSCFTRPALENIVKLAKKHNVIIIYDVAYRDFIQDTTLPKSIYEIEGAKEVAIEVGSFSKSFGFTGLRLGWATLPKNLTFEGNLSVSEYWSRFINTSFNGPSRVVQMAGLSALEADSILRSKEKLRSINKNANALKIKLKELGFTCFGGENAPYIWASFPRFSSSWDAFDFFLNNLHIATVPGIGFGKEGDGYIRLSAFPKGPIIQAALARMEQKSSCFLDPLTAKI